MTFTIALHNTPDVNNSIAGHLFDNRGDLVAAGEFLFEQGEDRDIEIRRRGYERVGEWVPHSDGTSVVKVVRVRGKKGARA